MEQDPEITGRRPVDLAKMGAVVIAAQNAIATLLAGQLRALRFGAVHSFANGDEAIDRLTVPPRIEAGILILEWDGPDQAELVRRLRRVGLRRVQEMPVIVIMARADIDMVIMARDSGANAVLARPISAAQLLDKVTWALSADIPFIRSEGYVGPDRRRFRGVEYEGEERRKGASTKSSERAR